MTGNKQKKKKTILAGLKNSLAMNMTINVRLASVVKRKTKQMKDVMIHYCDVFNSGGIIQRGISTILCKLAL